MITIGRTHRFPPSRCSNCGAILDAGEGFGNDHTIDPGDVSVCLCGHVMIFGEDLILRDLNDQEIYDLAGNKLLLQAQHLLGEFRAWEKLNRRERRRRSKRRP